MVQPFFLPLGRIRQQNPQRREMMVLWKRFFVNNDEKHLKLPEIPLAFCAKWLYNEIKL